MRWEDIDLDRQVVTIHVHKTDRVRVFPLQPPVVDLLRAEGPRVGRLFPWVRANDVYLWLRPLTHRLGVEFTPHMARRSLGTWLNESGAGLRTIMAALGHDSVQASIRYQTADVEIVRAAAAKIPQLRSGGKSA